MDPVRVPSCTDETNRPMAALTPALCLAAKAAKAAENLEREVESVAEPQFEPSTR